MAAISPVSFRPYRDILREDHPEVAQGLDRLFSAEEEQPTRREPWDFSFGKSLPIQPKQLTDQICSAIDGMFAAEQYAFQALGLTPSKDALTQADYLQLPLLNKEAFVHGTSIMEILDSWDTWITDPDSPEKILCAAVKDGCPADRIGAYQAYAQKDYSTLRRSICWAFVYAGDADLAAKHAYLDAYPCCRGEMSDAAVFLTAAAAYAFSMQPAQAVRNALYGMSLPFMNRVQRAVCPRNLSSDASPIDQCILFYHSVSLSYSLTTCLERLKDAHADLSLFLAAGILYGANDPKAPEQIGQTPAADRVETKLKHSRVFSKRDAAQRFTKMNPHVKKEKYAWESLKVRK